MKTLTKFKTKSGQEVELREPEMSYLSELLDFVNKIAKEDSYLSFNPNKPITLNEEETWLKSQIEGIKKDRIFLVWAVQDGKIIGSCDVVRGINFRDNHVGKVGLMVDRNFRRDGIGTFLLDFIIKKAKAMNLRIVSLTVFGDNFPAISLYKKMGFKEWGRLPDGLIREGKYSDSVKMYKEIK